ncbi:MAG: hypothetical protein NWE99_09265 [Candidatus Bathyarchaeota archaeon]|nr:hypothetical protein [Candidatus Bathyarchaeota archaeon]
MATQRKADEIAAIDQQLATLKEKLAQADLEAKGHIEKRDKLNEQFRKLRNETSELKAERDSLNEKVKALKQQRDNARDRNGKIIEEIKAHSQKINELKKKTPKKSRAQLEKELQAIEWKIQTTTLDLQEEKMLVDEVKHLEMQLSAYRKIDLQHKKIAELRKELKSLETSADAAHQELMEAAQKSQELHAKMLAKIDQAKNIKAEADSIHARYVQAREQAKPIREEVKRLLAQKRMLQEAMRKEDEAKRKMAEQALKENLESQARNKLQRGEKLSWHEFQLLAEENEPDSETQN